jgi:hypothetical protein
MTGPAPAGPRRNRVDPFGDLHAVPARGMLTGNRGCVVDDTGTVVRHHGATLWITCLTEFRGWRWPLARPRRWTPLFFLDDAVALAAGHRPCATCRRPDYTAYRDAATAALNADQPLLATELNTLLHDQRHRPGRGLDRARDRKVWTAPHRALPDGTVVVDDGNTARLIIGETWWRFDFTGWIDPAARPRAGSATVLTPPLSVAALASGYQPLLHPTASLRVPESGHDH